MLKDAASSAQPTKYAQNNRHGMYEGTIGRTDPTSERCRAPKTAKGTAKHKLLKATILSRPRARAISALAAHRAIRRIRMPALHIDTGVRGMSRNAARIIGCMWMAKSAGLYLRRVLRGQYGLKLYNEEKTPPLALDRRERQRGQPPPPRRPGKFTPFRARAKARQNKYDPLRGHKWPLFHAPESKGVCCKAALPRVPERKICDL